MKKFIVFTVLVAFCLTLMLPLTVSAASASANLTGPSAVRAGDTITVNFNLKGSGIYGASGTLSYDSSQLTLTGTSQKIASPWAVEFNGNTFVAYDNNLSNPINSQKTLFTAKFKVKSVAEGTKINISYTGVTATDGSADAKLGTVTYSTTVAAPMSTDNNLKSLTVSNATISPAFSASTTNYTASVPFDVAKLNVSATAADSKAKVAVNSPNLTPGGTTKVTVTVTAENGSKKVYTISVKREQDPNYKASGNNKLSSITVDNFLLSPGFDADTTQYVVWLPYETTSVTIGGSAADSKASVEVVGGDNLAAGQDNPVKVVCTAENGDEKTYTVIVKRAAAHDGTVDELPDGPEPSTPSTEQTTASTTTQTTPTKPVNVAPKSNGGVAWWLLIVVGVAALTLGYVFGSVLKRTDKK